MVDVSLVPAALAAREGKTRLKKCPKCGAKKPSTTENFDKKEDSSDGLQSYCKQCKSNMHKQKRAMNIDFRIRHHFTTRIRDQLKSACPDDLSRKTLNHLLGYRISALRRYLDEQVQLDKGITLRKAMEEGYHIDHIRPLHSFKCTEVTTEDGLNNFRECWAITNLKLISAEENLSKGGKYNG